ncbi:hypothetical protein BDM02DRAFT_3099702 [Thelephora ganbajun]|uniref:Uncharacterized protein n=1 Tax=Thelephora ganbajun TaxID=370292 RepID=A0ACB6ZBK4_THEGA|nr:hypothetical protein BDM02DRAFT_3099702 [Thelephora ganbajun]
MSDRETLLGMGFDPARVDWALKATNNRGLQPAMDHLLENEGNPVPDLSSVSSTATSTQPAGGEDPMDEDEDLEALRAIYGKGAGGSHSAQAEAEAKSIKCSECGKVFKNAALANYHAEKSGHDQFEESTEEIKPLTEEEKKEKIAELKTRLAEKRTKKAVEEAKEAQANEQIKRKSGKDLGKLRDELKAKESLKDMEKKKQEKLDDAKARARVKAQIEADKRERAEKVAREKALREGATLPQEPANASATVPPKPAAVAGKDFPETRLQIRMASGGQPYVTTLSSGATLQEVAEYLAGQTLAVDVETVNFAMHFPRKQFPRTDFSKTLRELGLTPSAVSLFGPHA